MRHFLDLRHMLVMVGAVLASALLFALINGAQDRGKALDAVAASNARGVASQQAASRRIDQLQATIADLTHEVQIAAANRATEDASIKVLSEQVKQLGGRPIVVATTTTTTQPTTSTTTASVDPLSTTTTTKVPSVKLQVSTTSTSRPATITTIKEKTNASR